MKMCVSLDMAIFSGAPQKTHIGVFRVLRVKTVLLELGLNPHDYGTHSFRCGGASFALEAGVPLDTISIMGDWKSDSVFLYLHMPLSQRLSAQRTLASHLTS